MKIRALVLTESQDRPGLLWDGAVEVPMPADGPLADVVFVSLQDEGVEMDVGDLLFFPDAAPGHRAVTLTEWGTLARAAWDR